MQNTIRFRRRPAISLFEVVVVVFLIGIVLGLLIPAVTTPRINTRRNQCSTNLKNLGLASIQYENARGQFPGWAMDFGYYGWDPDTQSETDQLGDPSDVSIASESLAKHRKIGTWAVAILPWLDAQPTYEHWTEDRYPIVTQGSQEFPASTGVSGVGYHPLAAPNLAIMQCPSDPNDVADHGRNSYVFNAGVAIDSSLETQAEWEIHCPNGTTEVLTFDESMSAELGVGGNQVVARRGANSDETITLSPPLKMGDFRDGQGNTVLFSESLLAMPWHRSGFTNRDDLIFKHHPEEIIYPEKSRFTNTMVWHSVDWENGGKPRDIHRINGAKDRLFTIEITPDDAMDYARPSSAHVEGVNAAMADGGTRFITDSIDMRIWQAMMTPAGRDTVPVDLE